MDIYTIFKLFFCLFVLIILVIDSCFFIELLNTINKDIDTDIGIGINAHSSDLTEEGEQVEQPSEPTEEEVFIKESQAYNIENFMKRIEQQRVQLDEEGLYDVKQQPTLEELGYFTGVESTEEKANES